MKNLIRLSIFALLISALSSCAIHSGYMNNSASLGEANFKYIEKNIYGSAKTVKIFGIGGSGEYALVHSAKLNMLDGYELKTNQALANITVNWKKTTFILVSTTTCVVTADIVEFR